MDRDKLYKLYGANSMKWEFTCTKCEHIQDGGDCIAMGLHPEQVSEKCILCGEEVVVNNPRNL